MASGSRSSSELSDRVVERIEAEVKQAALDHLRATDAATALGGYTEGAALVSNARWYSSIEWAELVEEFYRTLHEVHVAEWEEMRVDVVSRVAAVVTAVFRWSSTDTSGDTIDLRGVWTALYVRDSGGWRIRVRHESFNDVEE